MKKEMIGGMIALSLLAGTNTVTAEGVPALSEQPTGFNINDIILSGDGKPAWELNQGNDGITSSASCGPVCSLPEKGLDKVVSAWAQIATTVEQNGGNFINDWATVAKKTKQNDSELTSEWAQFIGTIKRDGDKSDTDWKTSIAVTLESADKQKWSNLFDITKVTEQELLEDIEMLTDINGSCPTTNNNC